MLKKRTKPGRRLVRMAGIVLLIALCPFAMAYELERSDFGSGGFDQTDGIYRARGAIGGLAAGKAAGGTFDSRVGFETTLVLIQA